jgi:uncharacterized phage-associated protein
MATKIKTSPLMKATNLAKIVLAHFDSKDDLVTNKKLQKVLYYIEAWSLVYFKSIVEEDFEAWVHGPVIHSLYAEYKKFGYAPIRSSYEKGESAEDKLTDLLKASKISKDHQELVFTVLNRYGSLSSYQLETLSHSETPWKQARQGLKPYQACGNVIDKNVMKSYYSSLVKK